MNRPLAELSSTAREAIEASLNKLLESSVLASSPRQKRLLEYLVTQTLCGQAERLKGYTIGVEVFGRGDDFDPNVDAIVRVEIGRLRNKLREYYEFDGEADAVRIELPKGAYIPLFSSRSAASPSARAGERHFAADKPTLLVLPLANISEGTGQDYFADGITDSLISELSRLSGMIVISRQTAFAYRNSPKRGDEIAEELGVEHLLEGSVQQAGQRVRISLQLVHAPSRRHLSSERFDRELGDIFAMQDDVTRRVVTALHVQLTQAENELFGHDRTASVAAHDALLRGLEQHWRYTPTSNDAARAFFSRALEIDPDYASAHAWLARAQTFRWVMRWGGDDHGVLEQALQHAERAVVLQPRMPYALSVLGWVQLWRGRQEASLAASWEAISLAPHNAEANMMLSMGLSSAGRGAEALTFIETALRYNPHPSAFYQFTLGQCYTALDDFDNAIAALRRGYEISDTFIPLPVTLCLIYAWLGREAEMRDYRAKTLALLNGKSAIHYPWLDPRLRARHEEMIRLAGLELPPPFPY